MRMSIAPEALPFATPLAVLTVIGLIIGWPWAVLPGLLMIVVLGFFRDPHRKIPADPRALVAAADGKVTDIELDWQGDEHLPAGPRVGVFLSVLDVHINRAPLGGEVVSIHHRPGKYLDARKPESSLVNESNLVCMRRGELKFGVRQISGAIARRIVCRVKPGDHLTRGEKFGLIRFGSRTEHHLPAGTEIAVKVGDKVRGGQTIIGWLPEGSAEGQPR